MSARSRKHGSFDKKTHHKKNSKSFTKSTDSGSGRIGRLDDDTMGYYRRVSETISEGFQDKTEQELFVANVFAQVEKEELKVSQNQTVSHILEKLLEMATGKQLCGFLQGLVTAGDVINAAKDRFAGHVLQTAILQAVLYVEDPDCRSDIEEVLLAVCKEVSSKLSEFIYHTYAAHVLSAVIEVLAGVKVPEQVTRSRLSQGQMHAKDHGREPKALLKEIPDSFLAELKNISHYVVDVDNFVDLLLNQVASPVVAVLLLVLKTADPDFCEALSKKIIKTCRLQTKQLNESTPPAMLTHPIASHVMEVLVQAASEKQFNKLCSSCFTGRYKQLAVHPTANYVLQRVVSRAVHMDMFEELFSELSSYIEDMMAVNHFGVVIRLAEACVLRPAQQGTFMLALLRAFHCCEPKERQPTCVLLMASLSTYEVYFGEETEDGDEKSKSASQDQVKSEWTSFIEDALQAECNTDDSQSTTVHIPKWKTSKKSLIMNFHGSLLLQQLLKFRNCGSVSAGFLAMSPDDVVAMSCDPAGSFLLEAFMASGVNEKKKDKLIDKLKGHCVRVACNKHGSRTIDSLFAAASMRSKFTIVEELAAKDNQIAGDQYGRHVHRNCAISHFKYRRGQWKELQGRETKKRKMFAEIIGEEGDTTKKKKKKQKSTDDVYFKEMTVLGVGMSAEQDFGKMDEDQGDQQESDNDSDEIRGIFSKMPKQARHRTEEAIDSKQKQSKQRKTDDVTVSKSDNEIRTSLPESPVKHKKKKKHKHAQKDSDHTEVQTQSVIDEQSIEVSRDSSKHRKKKSKRKSDVVQS